ncbi:type IV pilus modification PilV family protein [Leifsonia shinshuensis]|uniref:Prepilin-type N-terminal cleavage/methylation domain-containing protein n=1 Tax=Leifsonia shinshuensis TaxID=150026 RepID=A0A853CRG4_9MICO|nr:type II secretion system protein [Leifsonia shinshuensis]NYJ23002.1 prepilin-type N-terminal cleavage/methylation domain-containing protein [Leifsonia shinshuensis]
MIRFNTRPRHETREQGFTLIEVLVAMMVFGLLSVLVAYLLTSAMTITRSNRSSEVAANLAAQAIDQARSSTDVFSVLSGVTTTTVDGTTYTVTRSAGWLTNAGTASDCGTSGLLQNKTLNVAVTWSGMSAGASPVQASTLLAPAGPINDPTTGTIIVHVRNAAGVGVAGIPIGIAVDSTITPNTATTVSPAPPATDVDGCSYVLKVVPGSYVVTIGATGDGRISGDQQQPLKLSVPVTAGQSSVLDKQYDTAATPKLTLAPGSPATTMFPTNLTVTYVPQGDAYTAQVTMTTSGGVTTTSTPLFPYSSGYQAFAGTSVPVGPAGGGAAICLSVDPAAWTIPNASGNVGVRSDPIIGVTAGSTGTVTMKLVTVTGISGRWLVAVSAAAAATVGDPGCATGMSMAFAKAATNSVTLALPYGSWKLYSLANKTDTVSTSPVVASTSITLPAGSPAFTAGNIFTLDPRAP